MKILAVDDERLMLRALENTIREAVTDADVWSFRKGSDALAFARNHSVDVAFLDIHMRGMNGSELARKLRALYPKLAVIFCSGYDEYKEEAIQNTTCSGYITKPVDVEQIKAKMKHLCR